MMRRVHLPEMISEVLQTGQSESSIGRRVLVGKRAFSTRFRKYSYEALLCEALGQPVLLRIERTLRR